MGIKTSVFDASAQTTPEPSTFPPESQGLAPAHPSPSTPKGQVPYLPTHHDPVRLEIGEVLKGKPLVCMGMGYSNSRQKNAVEETRVVSTAVERHRPQTARARMGGEPGRYEYQRLSDEERGLAAEELAKTWSSRPNTVRGTRRMKVSRGGEDGGGGGGAGGEPMGSWGEVREPARTRRGATAPCTPWTPLVGRQWVMPADLVYFEHYASAPSGETLDLRAVGPK